MNAVSGPLMLATVDLGSNSFRLHICKEVNGTLQVIDSIKEMVRFAAGLDAQKNLSVEAQERALACLARFGERLQHFHPDHVRIVATNTFRVAKNINEFIPKAERALGFPIEVIAGREEARLIYTGVVHTLPFQQQQALVVDIGGGSTEFIIGREVQPLITESLPLGCVSYGMRFFPESRVNRKSFREAVNAAKSEIQRISRELKHLGWDFAIGTSGSARSIRDVIQMGSNPIDGINTPEMAKITEILIEAGSTRKARLPGLKADRVEVFAGSLAVMTAVFEELDIRHMTVTDAALRDGVLYDMLGRQVHEDMRDVTCAEFQLRYHADLQQAERVCQMAQQCLKAFASQWSAQKAAQWEPYVIWAARLHEIGLSIAHSGYHKHSAYILEHADMPGFSRKDQNILATLVLAHRGDLKKMLPLVHDADVWAAVFALRLAALFCRSRTEVYFPAQTLLRFDMNKRECALSIQKAWLEEYPLTASALAQESEQWQKIDFRFLIRAFD